MKEDPEFQRRLLATFKGEAQEHLAVLSSGLLEVEKAPSSEASARTMEEILRATHSLKGAARAVNQPRIESLCQPMEGILAAWKRNELPVSSERLDLLLRATSLLEQLLNEPGPASPALSHPVADMIEALNQAAAPDADVAAPRSPPSLPAASPSFQAASADSAARSAEESTVRVSTARLDILFREAEELLRTRQSLAQQAADLHQVHAALTAWRKQWTKAEADGRRLEELGNGSIPAASVAALKRLAEFLQWNRSAVESWEQRTADLSRALWQIERNLAAQATGLVAGARKLLLLPCAWLLDGFPRMVRDLARDQNKEVELTMVGAEIEMDRRILSEIKDPLIHLLRNSVDHGIEPPAQRLSIGKPRHGTIRLEITPRRGHWVEFRLQDDGRGLDFEKLKAAAVKLGGVTEQAARELTPHEASQLAFQSGLSTSSLVTELSGRGLGLAIVREKVEKLDGTVALECKPGEGTTVRIELPLELATFRGVVVRVQNRLYVLPAHRLERVLRVAPEQIKSVENRAAIEVNGQAVALVRMADVPGLEEGPRPAPVPAKQPAVVLTSGGLRVAFLVDEVCHEQEVVVKGLGPQLRRVRNLAGATLLGGERTALILETADLIGSAVRLSETGVLPRASASAETPSERPKALLVVEDSITSRTLLKSILEAAGYQVETAVDGVDGLAKLRSREFDGVISDVDMPRLNGFGLVGKIRADPKLAELPVVLVTALASREDRERGIEAGASAYIVKSSFDQSNLLEVVQRLI